MSSKLKTAVVVNDSSVVDGNTADAVIWNVPYTNTEDELRAGRAAVSDADTHLKHLEDAIVGASGKTKLTKLNTGANESLRLDLDATGVPNGYSPTANGAGDWSWASAGGGGAAPIDVTGTAGEALALREYVYLNESTSTWFKIDIDVAPVKCGRIRGIVTQALGIASSASGTIRLLGEISGYAGLTAWLPVYASSTAGGITQTRPSPTSGGAQVAIVEIGIAVSTTNIIVLSPKPVQYMKRNTLANDAVMTVQHHANEQGHTRKPFAYIGSTEAGSTITSYADTNQDTTFGLQGPDVTGAFETTGAQTGQPLVVGDGSGSEFRQAMSFRLSAAGVLSEFAFTLVASSGSPVGNLHWEIRANGASVPGTLILSGDVSSGSIIIGENIVSVANGPYMAASTTYWLVLHADAQASNVRWNWQGKNPGTYANGNRAFSSNGGSSWSTDTIDATLNVTVDAVNSGQKLAQGFQAGASDIELVRLYLRKKGAATGNLTVSIFSNSGGNPSAAITNGVSNTVAASGIGTSFEWVDFEFATNPTISGSTQYHIVLETTASQDNEDYIEWGVDASSPSYANGQLKSYDGANWNAETSDAIFDIVAPGTTFQETAVVGRWSSGTRDVAYRYDDGAGASGNTNTTGKNVTGTSADVTLVVEVP